MQSFTALSPEGIQAVKDANRGTSAPYRIRVAQDNEDYRTLRQAFVAGKDTLGVDEALRVELLEELISDNGLYLGTEEFDQVVDLLALLAESDERYSSNAASLLSGIAQTLEVEFI